MFLPVRGGAISVMKWPLSWEEKYDFRKKHFFRCDICNIKEDDDRAHAVDHDHRTDNIRGVLCQKCNMGLGNFRDNRRLLSIAIEYLKKHQTLNDDYQDDLDSVDSFIAERATHDLPEHI